MDGITTVTTKGQVTIPEAVRTALGIRVGDKVAFEQVEPKTKKVTFKVVPTNVVDELYGSLKSKTKIPYVPFKIVRQKAGYLLGKKYQIKGK